MALKDKFLAAGSNDVPRATVQLAALSSRSYETMERVFDWLDADPRRRRFMFVVSYSLLLWATFAVVYVVASLFF